MKIVGKVVKSCDGDVIYFTDGTLVTADHDGRLFAITEAGLRNREQATHCSDPDSVMDYDLSEEWK